MKKLLKKKLILISSIILIIFSITGITIYKNSKEKTVELSTEQKLEDFRYMYNILKNNYSYFDVNKRSNKGYDWLANKEEFEKSIKNTKNKIEFYWAIDSILKKLNNDHTNQIDPQLYYEMLEAYSKNKDKEDLNSWLKILDNKKVKDSYKELIDIFKKEYPKQFENYSSSKSIYDETNECRKKNIGTEILEQNKISYLKIETMGDEYIKSDKEEIYEFLKSIKGYPYLIIDIRGNGGGNPDYWQENIVAPLIDNNFKVENYSVFKGSNYALNFYKPRYKSKGIVINSIKVLPDNKNYPEEVKRDFKYCAAITEIIKPKNPVGFKGKIFLLVDRNVFSSSETFAMFAKYSKWATLVGEKTGGDGIGVDPILMTLPNSGLVVRFSGEMGLNSDGTSNAEMKTKPDIELNCEALGDKGVIYSTIEIIHQNEKK